MASEAQITKLIRAARRMERYLIRARMETLDAAMFQWSPERRAEAKRWQRLHGKARIVLLGRRAQAQPVPS